MITAKRIPSGLRKFLTMIMAAVLALSSAVIPASAATVDTADGFTVEKARSYSSTTVSIKKYTGQAKEVTLPVSADFNGSSTKITTVQAGAFDGTGVTSVTIPEGYDSLDSGAFKSLDTLETVNIPASMGMISANAFEGCTSLKNINFAAGGSSLRFFNAVFKDCTALESVNLPASTAAFNNATDANIFFGCTSLKSITVDAACENYFSENGLLFKKTGENTATLVAYPFGKNEASVTIPATAGVCSVTAIGAHCFRSDNVLTSVTIPASVAEIKLYAFAECGNLTDIRLLAETAPTVGSGAFSDLPSGSTITVKNDDVAAAVTGSSYFDSSKTEVKVGDPAAGGNTDPDPTPTPTPTPTPGGKLVGANVKDGVILGYYGEGGDIVIPNTITQIAGEAFKGNENITSITIPGSVSMIGYSAFQGCTALERIIFSDPKDGADLIIRVNAFSDCPKLKECTIPACAKYVTANVFKGCSSMKEIRVDADNPYYFTDSCGVMFGPWVNEGEPQYSDPNLTLIAYPNGREASFYALPERVNGRNVNRVWASAFSGAANLKNVDIPASYKSLSGYAFSDSGLEEITLPETITTFGGGGIFQGCTSLREVTLPSTMTELGHSEFGGCTSLQKINFPASGGPNQIGVDAFQNCKSLTSLVIPNSVVVIGVAAFEGCSNLQRVYIPASVTSFPNVDGDALNPFNDAASDIRVYVVPGSTGARWAASNAADFGWTYETVNGLSDLAAKDLGEFALTDVGAKLKVKGNFKMGVMLRSEEVLSGTEYNAFAGIAAGNALKVLNVSVEQEGALPGEMTLVAARPANMTSTAKLYALEGGNPAELDVIGAGTTMTAEVSHLGYFAFIDSNVAGGDSEEPASVSLNKSSLDLETDKSAQLSATVLPATAKNKTVTWKSYNESVATVSSRGVVKGISAGTAVIEASTVNGKTARCTVNVTGNANIPQPAVNCSADSMYIRSGKAKTADGKATFGLNLKNSNSIATVQVTLETDGESIEVRGLNGFTSLGNAKTEKTGGKCRVTTVLCYLDGSGKQLNAAGDTEIATIIVEGRTPSLSIKDGQVSGWDSSNTVSFGEIAAVVKDSVKFAGEKTYDLNGDGRVDILDITIAQGYYRCSSGDASGWDTAESCDFNGDGKVDVEDLISIMIHFGN